MPEGGIRTGLTVITLLVLVPMGGPILAREPEEVIQAEVEIPPEDLLDVGIAIFVPGLPEDNEHASEEEGVYPDVRKSESRFLPFHLKNTLESTGHWGAVRVVPPGIETVDVTVSGIILNSTGLEMEVEVHIVDSRGKVWRDSRYEWEAEAGAYNTDTIELRDPFQSLYNEIANDMLRARGKLDEEDLLEIRDLTRLRFGADLAPVVFAEYVSVGRKGRHEIEKLPAEGDPMLERIARIQMRDDMFIDTLNEYYAEFYSQMGRPYDAWRLNSYHEEVALREIRRQARTRKIIGGLLILAGIFADGGSTGAGIAKDAAVIGGAAAIQSGIQKSQEAKIHSEALRELAASFDAEMAPLLVEVEGRTLRLEGSAETQYAEWRRLLREIFASEIGLPPDLNAGPGLDGPETVDY